MVLLKLLGQVAVSPPHYHMEWTLRVEDVVCFLRDGVMNFSVWDLVIFLSALLLITLRLLLFVLGDKSLRLKLSWNPMMLYFLVCQYPNFLHGYQLYVRKWNVQLTSVNAVYQEDTLKYRVKLRRGRIIVTFRSSKISQLFQHLLKLWRCHLKPLLKLSWRT